VIHTYSIYYTQSYRYKPIGTPCAHIVHTSAHTWHRSRWPWSTRTHMYPRCLGLHLGLYTVQPTAELDHLWLRLFHYCGLLQEYREPELEAPACLVQTSPLANASRPPVNLFGTGLPSSPALNLGLVQILGASAAVRCRFNMEKHYAPPESPRQLSANTTVCRPTHRGWYTRPMLKQINVPNMNLVPNTDLVPNMNLVLGSKNNLEGDTW
jgi:hypothetical protein